MILKTENTANTENTEKTANTEKKYINFIELSKDKSKVNFFNPANPDDIYPVPTALIAEGELHKMYLAFLEGLKYKDSKAGK